jgi:hypothetical protein
LRLNLQYDRKQVLLLSETDIAMAFANGAAPMAGEPATQTFIGCLADRPKVWFGSIWVARMAEWQTVCDGSHA